MENLLEETIEFLEENGKKPKDVKWVGDKTVFFEWKHFEKIANKEYDSGYGSQEVLRNLLVVGDSWWLERHEYDGSEWWEYKEMPIKPNRECEVLGVLRNDYEDVMDYCFGRETLEELNLKGKLR